MEKHLRKALIVFGNLTIALGILQLVYYLLAVLTSSVGFTLSGVAAMTAILGSSTPIAIGTLCLFAAHSLSPLKKPFEK